MATKPSNILGHNPTRSNCEAIPLDKSSIGFLPAEKLPAQFVNDLFERTDRWLEYVRDGAWTGNTTITGTFGVTGNTTITGTLGVSGLVTATGGVTAAVNQQVTVSGTGRYRHAKFEKLVGASSFQYARTHNVAAGELVASDGYNFNGTENMVYGLDLDAGQTIVDIEWTVFTGGVGAQSMSLRRRPRDGTGTGSLIGSVIGNSNLAAPVLLSQTYNHVVSRDFFYFLFYGRSSSANQLFGAMIGYAT